MSEIFARLLFSIANRAHLDIFSIVFPLFFPFIAFPCAQFFSSCQSSKLCFRIEHGLSIWESLKYSFISMGLLQMSTNLSIVWKIFVFRIEVTSSIFFYFVSFSFSYSSFFDNAAALNRYFGNQWKIDIIIPWAAKFIHLDMIFHAVIIKANKLRLNYT